LIDPSAFKALVAEASETAARATAAGDRTSTNDAIIDIMRVFVAVRDSIRALRFTVYASPIVAREDA
jgi:hypothetical protein